MTKLAARRGLEMAEHASGSCLELFIRACSLSGVSILYRLRFASPGAWRERAYSWVGLVPPEESFLGLLVTS